jgi:chemotaxis protein histidine kinase CheA
MLKLNLSQSIDLLERHIGKDFITSGYDQYIISKDKLQALEQSYLDLGQSDPVFLRKLRNLSYIDIKVMISRYVLYKEEQASKLQKAVMPLEILGDTVLVQPEKGEKLVMSLVGIFRNALSHGIETPEERVSKGKDSFGKITCSTYVVDDILNLSIEEDGRGLDTKVLLDKAISDGIVGPDEDLNEKEILNLVFKDKMTTKEEADVLSGRGVGLSAIYDIITSIEGTIELESNLGKGSKFLIKVPMKCLID